jgi:hypothetical protein
VNETKAARARRVAVGIALALGVLGAIWLLAILASWIEVGAAVGTAILVALAAVLYARWRRVVGWTAVAVVAGLGVAWLLAEIAVERDWHDADGFTDCYPSCSAFQETVGLLYWGAPAAATLVVVAVLAMLLKGRARD